MYPNLPATCKHGRMRANNVTAGAIVAFSRTSNGCISQPFSDPQLSEKWVRIFKDYKKRTHYYPGWQDEYSYGTIEFDLDAVRIDDNAYPVTESGLFYISDGSDCITIVLTILFDPTAEFDTQAICEFSNFLKTPDQNSRVDLVYKDNTLNGGGLISYLASRILSLNNIFKHFQVVTYPVIYLGHVLDANAASDLIRDFRNDLCGIISGNRRDYLDLKNEEINARLIDHHPFDYGVTFINSFCALEAHPSNLMPIAQREGLSISNHNIQEYMFLIVLIVGVIHGLSRALYLDSEIDRTLEAAEIRSSGYGVLKVVISYFRIAKARRQAVSVLNRLTAKRPLRNDYTRDILDAIEDKLSLRAEITRIESKVEVIDSILNTSSQTIIASASCIITLLALFLAAVQTYNL